MSFDFAALKKHLAIIIIVERLKQTLMIVR